MNDEQVRRVLQSVQTIEKTGKRWKLTILLGTLGMVTGLGMAVMGGMYGSARFLAGGLVLGVGGIVARAVGSIGAWWCHG